MNASFYALFRRGKYGSLRPGLVGNLHKLPHQERERFVAAALGFTLRHSKGFRFWFLKNLLMLPPSFCITKSSDIAISMDEKQSEDLRLDRLDLAANSPAFIANSQDPFPILFKFSFLFGKNNHALFVFELFNEYIAAQPGIAVRAEGLSGDTVLGNIPRDIEAK